MSNEVSPTLSKIERRIKDIQAIEKNIGVLKFNIDTYDNKIDECILELDEFKEDLKFTKDRILALCKQARDEGFSEEYIQRFLRDHHYNLD